MIYLGLPAECPTPANEVAKRPLIWRYLKLSCVRQEWMSVLATIDLFLAHRRAISRTLVLSLASTALPRGFAPLPTRRGKPRLKVVPPTRKQKRRAKRRVALPALGQADCGKVSDIGAWKATQDELRLALFGDMNMVGAGDLEDCSSVSSASLDEFTEDRALDYYEPVAVDDLKTVADARAKGPLVKPSLKFLVREKSDAKTALPLSSFSAIHP